MSERTAASRTPAELAARLGGITNLCHGFIYFAPQAITAYDELGLAAHQHYFASRAAALGAVPAEVAIASFYNFCPAVAEAALPSAWSVATPEAIQTARIAAAGAALAEHCTDALTADELAEATDLAATICDTISYAGTPLAGGNRATPLPDEPLARLWQLVTTIREWRGDVHVAALVSEPLHPIEALILHAATGQVPVAALRATRGWSDDDWDAKVAGLADRGLVNADASFTPAGEATRAAIEDRTNAACVALVDAVGADGADRLFNLLKPWQAGLLASGIFPGTLRSAPKS
ncbi:MAG: hypothetical protein HKN26_15545 [Acidimicrobiales bacterium]|nr:hypothetical protein [Acidimicrobiales bacterium]